MKILAIDPGNIQSAFTVIDSETYEPIAFGKEDNEAIYKKGRTWWKFAERVVIEMVACYGMPVGREVFDTCIWIGRFASMAEQNGREVEMIVRNQVKIILCNSSKAGDANIRRVLIDRFAKHDLKNGKGTKNKPDWFYGFAADVWQSYALGVAYIDQQRGPEAVVMGL